ncbi:MAG: dihydroorotase [Verrucomicrobiales bacterium]|nr:dihydroorotase [Verrucomicrobiales bacterium]
MKAGVILFKGGQVATEDSPQLKKLDVLVEDGKIAQVAADLPIPEGAEVVDCVGCVLAPAMFDMHVHAREPGREDQETIATCSEAAINGGVTGLVLMPNTLPTIDSGGLLQSVLDIAAEKSRIPIWQAGCITKGREGKELAGIAGMKGKGAPLLTDGGDSIADAMVLLRAMEYAKRFDLMLALHCETKELSGKGAMNEGQVSYRLGIPGIPACSEEICISRDIRLAQYTGARLHIQHLSSAEGVATIRRFKEAGVRVTCEVAPHHLLFTEEQIGDYDTRYKTNPPLRTAADNEALLQALAEGWIDVIASSHAPHTEFEKNSDFGSAPFGITGLDTAVVSLYHHFVKTGVFGWDVLVKRYSAEPRRLCQVEPVPIEVGGAAEFLVFDPNRKTWFSKKFMQSKSSNTPFLDQELDGQIISVMKDGEFLLNR